MVVPCTLTRASTVTSVGALLAFSIQGSDRSLCQNIAILVSHRSLGPDGEVFERARGERDSQGQPRCRGGRPLRGRPEFGCLDFSIPDDHDPYSGVDAGFCYETGFMLMGIGWTECDQIRGLIGSWSVSGRLTEWHD
jgi:hypothetical protein